MAKLFWFKFYFKDWADDVKPLSLAARGLLIELIIHLRKNNGSMVIDFRLISRLTGSATEEIKVAIEEFREYGIFDFEVDGKNEVLISRKIIKEIHISTVNTENGGKGGNPKLKDSVGKSVKDSVNRKDNRTPIFNSNSIYNNKEGQKKEIPTEVEFLEFCQTIKEFDFKELEFSLKAKYEAWVTDGWKDGHGKPIKNWKSKLKNTIVHLKPIKKPGDNQPRQTYSNIKL